MIPCLRAGMSLSADAQLFCSASTGPNNHVSVDHGLSDLNLPGFQQAD